jgi:DNA-binding response OmpR family regulator
MRVVLIEDDDAVAAGLADALSAVGHAVVRFATGASGLESASADPPELVVLDLGLPDIDGTDVCRQLRAQSTVPIIVVSARSDEIDRVLALEMGADDYLVKPFGTRELIARIRAVTRRTNAAPPEDAGEVQRGSLVIDRPGRKVTLRGEPVHLTATEFEVLAYLADEPGVVRRRPDILRDVWRTEWFGASKTLDAHIAAVRKKLGSPGWIQSVRGVGFRFEVVE